MTAILVIVVVYAIGATVAWYEVKHAIEIDKDDKNF